MIYERLIQDHKNLVDILEDCDLEFKIDRTHADSMGMFNGIGIDMNFGKNNKTPFFVNNADSHHRIFQSSITGLMLHESRVTRREVVDTLNKSDVMMKRIYDLTGYKLRYYNILGITGPYPEYEARLHFEKPVEPVKYIISYVK